MIQFSGHLSGAAKTFFWKRHKKFDITAISIGLLMFTPFVLLVSFLLAWQVLIWYGAILLGIAVCLFLPPSKSAVKKTEPIKIYTEEEYIICVTEDGKETVRNMYEATKMVDAGSYYYLVFPYGQVSMDFVLQKDLLAEGTFKELESFFDGKIERIPACAENE